MAVARIFNHDVHAFLETVLVQFSIGQYVLNIDIVDPVPIVQQSSVDLENL
jgi:hypothetical protein